MRRYSSATATLNSELKTMIFPGKPNARTAATSASPFINGMW